MGSKTTLKKYLLCSTGGKKTSYWFAKTWGLINNKTFFIYIFLCELSILNQTLLSINYNICLYMTTMIQKSSNVNSGYYCFLKNPFEYSHLLYINQYNSHVFKNAESTLGNKQLPCDCSWTHSVLWRVWAGHKFKCATVLYNYFLFHRLLSEKYANHNSQKLNHLAIFKALCTS